MFDLKLEPWSVWMMYKTSKCDINLLAKTRAIVTAF